MQNFIERHIECSGFLDYDIQDLRNVSFSANLSELLDFRKTLPSIIVVLQLFSSRECPKSLTTYYCNFAYPFRCEWTYPMGELGRQSSHEGTKEKSHVDLPPNGILQILVLSQFHQWR